MRVKDKRWQNILPEAGDLIATDSHVTILSSIGTWKAYECGNADSDYRRCLLNIGINGETRKKIVWQGCTSGRKKSNG